MSVDNTRSSATTSCPTADHRTSESCRRRCGKILLRCTATHTITSTLSTEIATQLLHCVIQQSTCMHCSYSNFSRTKRCLPREGVHSDVAWADGRVDPSDWADRGNCIRHSRMTFKTTFHCHDTRARKTIMSLCHCKLTHAQNCN
jgi:hypothetical protein